MFVQATGFIQFVHFIQCETTLVKLGFSAVSFDLLLSICTSRPHSLDLLEINYFENLLFKYTHL